MRSCGSPANKTSERLGWDVVAYHRQRNFCQAELNKVVADNGPDGGKPNESPNDVSNQKHHSLLLQMLATQAGCKSDDICDFELQACDTQPSIIAGAMKEFIFSGRLDNLCMSFCSLKALIDATVSEKSLEDESVVRMVALFDHEEVGSSLAQGAGSPVMFDALNRITTFFSSNPQLKQSKEASWCLLIWRMHCIQITCGNIIGLALWHEMALNFNVQKYQSMQKPVVIAVGSCWVRRFNGIHLSGTSATHWYLNPNIPDLPNQTIQLTDTKPVLNVDNQRYEDVEQEKNRNRFPLAVLLEVDPQNYQRVKFTSEATIYKIHKRNGITKGGHLRKTDHTRRTAPQVPTPILSERSGRFHSCFIITGVGNQELQLSNGSLLRIHVEEDLSISTVY
ncbi:probable aspartyl aminopeptidase [Tanacetum coccineum]